MKAADVVKFITLNRKGKAFFAFTIPEIIAIVNQAIDDKTIGVALDGKRIVGVAVGSKNERKKTLHIMHILTIKKGAVKQLLELQKALYPGYEITGNRHSRFKVFSDKVINQFALKGI